MKIGHKNLKGKFSFLFDNFSPINSFIFPNYNLFSPIQRIKNINKICVQSLNIHYFWGKWGGMSSCEIYTPGILSLTVP